MTSPHKESKSHSKTTTEHPGKWQLAPACAGASAGRPAENKGSFKHLAFHSSNLVMMFTDRIWHPPTDVYETATEVVIKSEIAGVNPAEIKISVDERNITIKGSRPDQCLTPKRVFRQMEINYGKFERVLSISAPIDPAGAHASYREGFLEVVIPKAQKDRVTVTHIEIHFEK